MTRRIALLTKDSRFESFIKTIALTLTKLNYQVDIFSEVKSDIDLVIMDFDYEENISALKEIRKNPSLENKKIIGIVTDDKNKKILFESGCDAVMTKKEFEVVGDNILMY
jgi:hypothetical protein